MLVDEYQDTNTVAQYLWLRLLAQGPPTTSAASATTTSRSMAGEAPMIDNILRFEKDFPGARVIRLERNYRSTAANPGARPRASSRTERKTASARRSTPTARKASG